MKQKSFNFIFLLFLISCSSSNLVDKQVHEFNEVLKQKNVESLKLAIESFEIFLDVNFDKNKTDKEKIVEFLKTYLDKDYISNNWIFNDTLDKKALLEYENSGLRKEFYYYNFEDTGNFEVLPIVKQKIKSNEINEFNEDSVIHFCHFGLYSEALKNISSPDSVLIDYIAAKDAAGMMGYDFQIGGLLALIERHNYNIEIFKRIIIFEFYYDLIYWNIKRNEKFSA